MKEMVESQVRCMLLLDQMVCSRARVHNLPRSLSALPLWPSSRTAAGKGSNSQSVQTGERQHDYFHDISGDVVFQ